MKIISHRGNLKGSNHNTENTLQGISLALESGFDVEIDVWFKNNKWYLGHDKPTELIEEKFLENKKLWCHAKNLDGLYLMLQNKKIHCFWHENDDFTLTSQNFIWTYPNKNVTKNSVIVIKDLNYKIFESKCFGICTDDPYYYESLIS
jgi:glycerophosphoryl diester phosphodiesterase